MASVLRSPTLDTDRVRDASQPLLVDPDWQQLLSEATERAYEEGLAAGIEKGRSEREETAASLGAALDVAVARVTEEIRECARSSTEDLANTALAIVKELTGSLRVEEETLRHRVEQALSDLDGATLQILVASDDVEHLAGSFGKDSRYEIVADPDLSQGEARIVGEWCHADLRWSTVLDVLREALDA